jgi:hypothetical protein
MEVTGQFHCPIALPPPPERSPESVLTLWRRGKSRNAWNWTWACQPIACCYTDWAIPTPCHWNLSWVKLIPSAPFHPMSLRFVLIIPSWRHLRLEMGPFPAGFGEVARLVRSLVGIAMDCGLDDRGIGFQFPAVPGDISQRSDRLWDASSLLCIWALPLWV